jgi:ferritin
MNLKPNLLDALNTQLNAEMASTYLYLSMAAHFESRNFRGMSHWMQTQAREEWSHAMKIFGYINERGGQVTLKQIDAPKSQWGSVLEVFQDSLNHECLVSDRIHGLVRLAISESDFATQSFLQWFINEQVEEEAQTNLIVEKLKMMGDGNIGLFILDGELGKRAAE